MKASTYRPPSLSFPPSLPFPLPPYLQQSRCSFWHTLAAFMKEGGREGRREGGKEEGGRLYLQ